VGKGWANGGLIASFNIYISHVKKFTSKTNEEGGGFRNFFSFLIVCDVKRRGKRINGPEYTTSIYVLYSMYVYVYKHTCVCVCVCVCV
jgi:hypothetical protein